MTLDTNTTIIIVVVVILAIVILGLALSRRRRTDRLRQRFGPEYDQVVRTTGDRQKAEADLMSRERRRDALDIKPLTPEQRDRYSAAWKSAQARFVDDPREALARSEGIVQDVMAARGYPVADFDQQASDLSVDHANVIRDFREAHAISSDPSHASTEDLRRAMVIYRSLFDELIAAPKLDRSKEPDSAGPATRRSA